MNLFEVARKNIIDIYIIKSDIIKCLAIRVA